MTTGEYLRISFLGDENVLKLIVVIIAQLCERIKNHFRLAVSRKIRLPAGPQAKIKTLSEKENLKAKWAGGSSGR
jgi:hypothetical protein